MKKALALLMVLILTISLTGSPVFADEIGETSQESSSSGLTEGSQESPSDEPPPEDDGEVSALISGSVLVPVSQLPPEMYLGDTVTFAISSTSFPAFADFDATTLSLSMPDAAYFEHRFTKDENGVYLSLKAYSLFSRRSITLYVTDGTVLSAPYTFITSVSEPPPSPESSAPEEEEDSDSGLSDEPESSTSSEPESSTSSEPESSSSSESESSVSSEPESSASSEPESSTSSEPESSTSSEPESSESGADGDDEPDSPIDNVPVRITTFFQTPTFQATMTVSAPPEIKTDITGVATSGVTAWRPIRGLPANKPLTVNTNNVIEFSIPNNNFELGTTTTPNGANISWLNGIKNQVSLGSLDVLKYFDVSFILVDRVGETFGIRLTPNASADFDSGFLIPAGTKFGFKDASSMYRIPYDLLIVRANAGNPKAIGIAWGQLGGDNTWMTLNGSYINNSAVDFYDTRQGDEYIIHFLPSFFEWNGGVAPQKVTLSSIRGKISLRQAATTRSNIFESVALTSVKGEAAVRIKFKQPLATTHALDFKTTLYLTVGGRRDEASKLEIEGRIDDVEPQEFYSEDKDINVSDGIVGRAMETIIRPSVYIGDGVTVNAAAIRRNSKFYGMATTSIISKADEDILDMYPDISEVYTLVTVGLNGAGATVDIDTYNGFHVYDEDLNYLGRSTKKLEYSDKYYLSEKLLDIFYEGEDEYEDDWIEVDYPGKTSPDNPYANPATGG